MGLWRSEKIEYNIKKAPNKKLSTILSENFEKIISKTNNISIGTDTWVVLLFNLCHKKI